MKRRYFLKYLSLGATAALVVPTRGSVQSGNQNGRQTSPPQRYQEWIAARVANVINKDYVDAFLDTAQTTNGPGLIPSWVTS